MTICKDDSKLFLEFIIANGFNPNNYDGILELGQPAHSSMSKYLKNYRQYLVSKQVEYSELKECGIEGANGYILDNEIFVPKSLKNDEHFLYNAPKVPYKRYSYSYPSIDEFDTVICNGTDWLYALELTPDKFYGTCLSTESFNPSSNLSDNIGFTKLNKIILRDKFITIANYMSDCSKKKYEVIHDTDSKLDKEFYLIKRKK